MSKTLGAFVLRLGLAVLILSVSGRPGRAGEVTEPPPFEQFVVVPLRVHLFQSAELPEVDCALTDADVTRIVGKVNRVWNKAGVHFGLVSIVREPAANAERFRNLRDLTGEVRLGSFRMLVPREQHAREGLHVYYLHDFPVNGVYFGENFAVVKETAALREVEGGLDEPIPRVTAHELGHALGLPHREDRTNLLASGRTGTSLNAEEVANAREKVLEYPGVATVTTLKAQAEEAEAQGNPARARKLWTWLSQIPGGEGFAGRLPRP